MDPSLFSPQPVRMVGFMRRAQSLPASVSLPASHPALRTLPSSPPRIALLGTAAVWRVGLLMGVVLPAGWQWTCVDPVAHAEEWTPVAYSAPPVTRTPFCMA